MQNREQKLKHRAVTGINEKQKPDTHLEIRAEKNLNIWPTVSPCQPMPNTPRTRKRLSLSGILEDDEIGRKPINKIKTTNQVEEEEENINMIFNLSSIKPNGSVELIKSSSEMTNISNSSFLDITEESCCYFDEEFDSLLNKCNKMSIHSQEILN